MHSLFLMCSMLPRQMTAQFAHGICVLFGRGRSLFRSFLSHFVEVCVFVCACLCARVYMHMLMPQIVITSIWSIHFELHTKLRRSCVQSLFNLLTAFIWSGSSSFISSLNSICSVCVCVWLWSSLVGCCCGLSSVELAKQWTVLLWGLFNFFCFRQSFADIGTPLSQWGALYMEVDCTRFALWMTQCR